MTQEVRQRVFSKFIEAGIGVVILAVVVYFQRMDVNTLSVKVDTLESNFVQHLTNDHSEAVKIIELNNQLMSKIEQNLSR